MALIQVLSSGTPGAYFNEYIIVCLKRQRTHINANKLGVFWESHRFWNIPIRRDVQHFVYYSDYLLMDTFVLSKLFPFHKYGLPVHTIYVTLCYILRVH